MTDPGNVFVVRGDITRCQADAVVFSTSVELRGGGEMQSSFSEWPGFLAWYSELRSEGRREVGDTDWLPPRADKPGVVLVRSVGLADPESDGDADIESEIRFLGLQDRRDFRVTLTSFMASTKTGFDRWAEKKLGSPRFEQTVP